MAGLVRNDGICECQQEWCEGLSEVRSNPRRDEVSSNVGFFGKGIELEV
jgi:hypothetical protein